MANSKIKILIPMLALCILAGSAYGQAILSLGSNPTRVRAEGITEAVGLITLTNTTGVAQYIPAGTAINISFDGNITNDPGVATTSNALNAAGTPNRNIYTSGQATSSQADGVAGGGGVAEAQYLPPAGGCTNGGVCTGIVVTRSGQNITLFFQAANFINTVWVAGATANTTAAPSCDSNAAAGQHQFCLMPNASLNIQGVRVNVASLSASLPPAAPFFVNALMTTTPINAISIPTGSSLVVVGRAQGTIASAGVVSARRIGQCSVPTPPTLNGDGTLASGGGLFANTVPVNFGNFNGGNLATTVSAFNVNVVESFSTAFSAADSYATVPPFIFDEAGITPGGSSGVNYVNLGAIPPPILTGQAGFQGFAPPVTRGLQLVFNFASLPAGVSVVAELIPPNTGGSTTGTGVTGTNQVGNGAAPPDVLNFAALSGSGAPGTTPGFALLAGSGGATSIAYELIGQGSSGPTTVDTASFTFALVAPTGTVVPIGSMGTVSVSVGPVSSVTSFSTTATQLRFAANTGVPAAGSTIATAIPCITNLLFPFVSNRTGTTFNTGIAIANTANDATFSQSKNQTTGETGGVTLYFFGVGGPTGGTGGIALPIPAVSTGGTVATSGVIAPGEHTAFVLNDGSTKALAPGFQGYIVALCNFRYAHALASIFDNFGVGPANVGFSYLGLVINGTTIARNASAVSSTVPSNNAGTTPCAPGAECLTH